MIGLNHTLMATGLLFATPAFASGADECGAEEMELQQLGDLEASTPALHPGRGRPHPHPHPNRRFRRLNRWRHGGHYAMTASISMKTLFLADGMGAGQEASLEFRAAPRTSLRVGLDQFGAGAFPGDDMIGVSVGGRQYAAGDFERGVYVGGEFTMSGAIEDGETSALSGGLFLGAKVIARGGLTVEVEVGGGGLSAATDTGTLPVAEGPVATLQVSLGGSL